MLELSFVHFQVINKFELGTKQKQKKKKKRKLPKVTAMQVSTDYCGLNIDKSSTHLICRCNADTACVCTSYTFISPEIL